MRGVLLALLLGCGRAYGATAEGALLTNIASATYRLTAGAGQLVTWNATATVLVRCPRIVTMKSASPTIQAPGGTVTFCVSFSNVGESASAMNLVITDRIPDNMRFLEGEVINDPEGGVITATWSSLEAGAAWNAFPPAVGQGNVNYLRWAVNYVGTKKSGYICYKVTIL